MQEKLKLVTDSYLKKNLPKFKAGDVVTVNVRVIEGNKERIQPFKGRVISKNGGDIAQTFTVRKVSSGIGIERTFPIHSPKIESIKVESLGVVRRSKLFYLRGLSAKKARIKEKRTN